MAHLSLEAKEALLLKALARTSGSLRELAKAHNVGYSTLQRWLREHKANIDLPAAKTTSAAVCSREARFAHLLATANLDEVALGAYCREHGLYSHQLELWKAEFMKDNIPTNADKATEIRQLRNENKRLTKELERKDKALAEAAALLILKKKANLLWGVSEDD